MITAALLLAVVLLVKYRTLRGVAAVLFAIAFGYSDPWLAAVVIGLVAALYGGNVEVMHCYR
jgi:hypothetical protein